MMVIEKKGQVESNTLIYLIIALVVGVLVILGFYYLYYLPASTIGSLIPGDLQAKILACNGDAKVNLVQAYCNDFQSIKTVSGGSMFVSCMYPNVQTQVDDKGFGSKCSSEAAKNYCTSLQNEKKASYDDSITVNGQTCSQLGVSKKFVTCAQLVPAGTWQISTECTGSGASDQTNSVSDSADRNANTDKVCCVKTSN